MNREYEIYQEVSSLIPTEDTARLDGYLHARAEADTIASDRAKLAALKLKMLKFEHSHRS